jgi:nucleotide-binding universal stress UspA family protein
MRPILLTTDGSSTAAEASKTAIEFAAAFEAPILIVSIWDFALEPVGMGFGPVIPDLDLVGHEQALKVVEEAAEPARKAGLDVETIIRRGTPVEQICAIADEHDARMIVLGSHGWGALRRTLFGSVSTGVLHRARQPVLVVRRSETVPATEAAEREKALV